MSVFVKGMNMPRSCWECNLHCFRDKEKIKWGPITIIPEDFRCGGNNEWHETNEFDFLNERHPDCPIVEIPAPHGRLIDADRLLAVLKSMASTNESVPTTAVLELIDHQPVVLKAEVSE